jgi:pimeloyl-ACP methyl ester carboxylesterase
MASAVSSDGVLDVQLTTLRVLGGMAPTRSSCLLPPTRPASCSETDLTEDLQKIDVPTLVLHGDDDQIVPIGASAMLSSKLIKNATLKIYKGASHGLCSTHKNQVNAGLLAFIKG